MLLFFCRFSWKKTFEKSDEEAEEGKESISLFVFHRFSFELLSSLFDLLFPISTAKSVDSLFWTDKDDQDYSESTMRERLEQREKEKYITRTPDWEIILYLWAEFVVRSACFVIWEKSNLSRKSDFSSRTSSDINERVRDHFSFIFEP